MSEPVTFLDGQVQLYLGDCREILPTLGKVDAVVTDPPYGVGMGIRANGGNEPCIIGEIKQNRASDRVLDGRHVALRDEALRLAGTRAIVFGAWRAPRPAATRMRIIWDKGQIGMGGFGPWRPNDEEIYVIGTGWVDSKDTPTVIQCKQISGFNRDHPTPKPVELMTRILGWCQPVWNILDPFMGSGTTGVAAIKLGRKFIGIEIEERYFQIACRRIEEATKQADLFIERPPAPKQEALL